MHVWRRFINRKSLGWLSGGALSCAGVGSLAFGGAFWLDTGWMLVAALVLSCVAWSVYWALKSAVESGLAADRWTDLLRRDIKQAIGRVNLWLMPLWLSLLIVHFVRVWGFHHGRANAMVWFPIWLFVQASSTMTRMIAPSLPPSERTTILASMEPIHSEHWGERAS